MENNANSIPVYLEIGKKKTFAGAIDWPGWCRSGRDEDAALQALLDYGPRYAVVVQPTQLGFEALGDLSAFNILERSEGNTTTDFGSPAVAPISDSQPVSEDELQRYIRVLQGSWQAFDKAAASAAGHELRKGPRGGGRDLDAIVQHVLAAEGAYLRKLGWEFSKGGILCSPGAPGGYGY